MNCKSDTDIELMRRFELVEFRQTSGIDGIGVVKDEAIANPTCLPCNSVQYINITTSFRSGIVSIQDSAYGPEKELV